MKVFYVLLATLFIAFYSCKQNTSETTEKVYTVDELTEAAYDIVGDTLSVSGFCADMCQGGDWIVLQGSDSTKAIQAIANKQLSAFNSELKFNNLTVKGILHEKRVDSLFLVDWETKLDESLKGPNGNPAAVAQLKQQIAQIYDAMRENREKHGRNYWSQFTLEVSEYTTDKK